ncbi:uncharacterized protein LOC122570201 isoform X2 [Bombus pyrosoma]|uniref:uncharacterized protein LOC122570201 isoform X2 n=1 Tax=Bombus pyrosoma TaxID=396416 RepID=UPI001CB8A965|nr:uncharacterized protein LOC122570201 isoform X2 [Bombus pyrosoma]
MLAKVIDDEERQSGQLHEQEMTSAVRSLSSDSIKTSQERKRVSLAAKFVEIHPCNNATSGRMISKRSKSQENLSCLDRKRNSTGETITKEKREKRVKYVPCPSFRPKKNDSRDHEIDELLYYKPTRDVESQEIEYLAAVPNTSMDTRFNRDFPLTKENGNSYELPFLKCPLCGWEDVKHEQIDCNKNERRNYISCSEYNKNLSNGYSPCAGCDRVTRDNLLFRSMGITDLSEYLKKYVSNSEDLEFLQTLSRHASFASLITRHPSVVTLITGLSARTSITSAVKPIQITKKCAHTEVEQSEDPKKVLKNNIPASISVQTQVLQVDPVVTGKLQLGTIEASTQLVLADPDKHSKAIEFVPKDVSRDTKKEQGTESEPLAIETRFSIGRKKREIGVNAMDSFDKAVQNTVCISIQTTDEIDQKGKEQDKYYKTDTIEMKEVAINVVDQASKGIQSSICVSRGNLAYRMSFEKMVEFGTTMSLHQVRSVGCVTAEKIKEFKSNFVQCVSKEKFPLARSKSDDSVKRCARRDTELKHFVEKGTQEFEDSCTTDTCPLNILHLSRDPVMLSVLQQLLQKILFIHEQKMQDKYKYRLKENCFIDMDKMVTAIKEYIMMLEPSVIRDDVKEFHEKVDKKSSFTEVRRRPSLKEIGTFTMCNDKLTMTEEDIFELILQSTFMKMDKRQGTMEDSILLLEKMKRKYPMIDKEVCTHLNCKDVGISGSLMQLCNRDIEVQGDTRLFKDSVCVAKYEDITERISVGTQKRDPILVRVIKCNESQAVVRSDKETLTMKKDVHFEKKCISKRVETCGRSTCIPSTVCKTTNEANLKSTLRKERENEMIDSYDICDINCKGKISYDWTDVTNDILSNVTNSKIPICMRPLQKYTYARSK